MTYWNDRRAAVKRIRKARGKEYRGEKLGNLIADLAEAADITHQEIGEVAGISASTVGQIISGSIICPPMKRLEGIAKALGVSTSRLVTVAEADGCDYSDD